MNTAIDINSNGRYWPQFDPCAPPTKLEALQDGDEAMAMEFADWLASDGQREQLHDLLSYLSEDPVVQGLARKWAKQAG